jgi:hypothetical protein
MVRRSAFAFVVMALVVWAQSESPTASKLSLEEKEQFLKTANIGTTKDLSMGVTNSRKASLDDGKTKHDAHIQTIEVSKASYQTQRGTELNFRDSYKYNMAAYELGKLLGLENMIPPSVERKVGGSSAAVTWWVDDTLMTELERTKKSQQPPDLDRWNKQMYVVRVFDQLIYNTDRNLGNLVIDKDWNIWMIDHTRAFRLMNKLENPKNLVQCDKNMLAKLKALDKKAIQGRVGKYLTGMEVDGILKRRDQIVKFFDEEVAKKGESAVLFDLPPRG